MGLVEQELLFDGIDDSYYEYVKPDKTLSDVSGDDDWILHFVINEVGYHVTNPSWWRLELVSKFQWWAQGTPETLKNFKSFKHTVNDKWSVHMKPALNAERYMLEDTRIVVGESKRNINATSPYLNRLSALIMYMLKLSMPEKKDHALQRLTYNRPGLLCGKGRDYIGGADATDPIKEPEQILPKARWDSAKAERDFDDDSKGSNGTTPLQVKFMCEPLPGPFAMFNQMVPGTFNPEVIIKLNKELRQWLIVRLGSAAGHETNSEKAKQDPKAKLSGGDKTINVKWEIDLSKTFLRIGFLSIPITMEVIKLSNNSMVKSMSSSGENHSNPYDSCVGEWNRTLTTYKMQYKTNGRDPIVWSKLAFIEIIPNVTTSKEVL